MPDLFAFIIFTIFIEIWVPKVMSFHFSILFALISTTFSTNCVFHKMTALRKNRLTWWFLPTIRSKMGLILNISCLFYPEILFFQKCSLTGMTKNINNGIWKT